MILRTQMSFEKHDTGKLYLIPTPIGNLEDMTFRAVNLLKEVDLIAAEDTRNTQKLLNHFEIKTKQISFHEHNTESRIPELIKKMEDGLNIGQVSDAGMPSISDPGHELVERCIEMGIPVVSIPGPSAGMTSLIASGLSPQPFLFYGFLNRKSKEQRAELEELSQEKPTLIFYEAPHRLKKTLVNLQKVLGNRKATLGRELTKRYEEYIRGTLDDLVQWSQDTQIRGEFVIMVAGNPDGTLVDNADEDALLALSIEDQVQKLIDSGEKTNAAIKQVAKLNQLVRQDVYNQFHKIG
ncbi:16S rRNA (cytidine(1402)-2'-O)-methyltransferase [Fructilactobacillus sanfranciscensis]|uniref:16S rRNA (cytidine(1402)-2'-O)-methyltransferase n=1 Tax=Fructilactobacillus sanfranciscensis TaxID=1625 RepID=UPI000CD3D2A2|nr:16S rRNA (cytidine(1402)-2'-O)-methyltransferase [Fructilactobacillus sanfranciscensis]NDR69747.1 16S rRNA (cytidine(1402)-2'-O)-methyltransferase [Fructilactobacillus sanfranciscensis]NDS16469.1 16S rRNA (cytidine(1402)-2'-O)-methyltransferase [Fructilactobacillus sanfranciscensis]POH13731.1 16S rRNA (cytidine(1402)-2'-O)-methyltransferase [Fructilactobacillus sanfranciscensis]POH19543.1 16S rRNA (cytidine(1402)-2'-O)-methyltransferase [Fructilactobacillus sanfranciscensis]TNK99712.1 16S r